MIKIQKKILVVDDNEDISMVIKMMLQAKGYTVDTKNEALHIREYIDSFKPKLLVMDMLLSGADGRDVCRELKSEYNYQTLPVLMISAHPNARKDCIKAGANAFLEKPFDMHDLYQTVEEFFL